MVWGGFVASNVGKESDEDGRGTWQSSPNIAANFYGKGAQQRNLNMANFTVFSAVLAMDISRRNAE